MRTMSSNKDYLSQEEIDALLRQTSEDEESDLGGFSTDFPPDVNDYLTSMEQDTLGEIGNITFGSAATALSTLLGQKVDITTPKVSVVAYSGLALEFPKPHVAIKVNYVEGFQGINLLVIQTNDARVIADLMLGGDGTNVSGELNDIHLSAVQEAMNQMMGSAATSMSTIFNRFVNISPPGIAVFDFNTGEGLENFPDDEILVKVSFRLAIGTLIDSTIMQLLPVGFAKELVASLMGNAGMAEPQAEPKETPPPAAAAPPRRQPEPFAAAANVPPADSVQPPMPPNFGEQPAYGQSAASAPKIPNRNVNVQPVQFGGFQGVPAGAEQTNLELLLDIPLRVTVELGRTKKMIKEILELSQGSIIELDKLAGEPVDILVNNKLIAKGEVVVIDENFGVRVTDIISQMDRIQKIQ